MKFPKFSGNCRDWPQFKKDFEKQVSSVIVDESTVSYALRNALPDNAKSLVRNMSDNIKEMWTRLDERYGDEGKIVEIVLNGIKHFRPIKENEERRLLAFIDIIEKASMELKYLGREPGIKNSTIISIIEEKLPDDLRKKWIERIYEKDSAIDKGDKFPGFLKFLLERKMVVEYDLNLLKRNKEEVKANVRLNLVGDSGQKPATPKCFLHPGSEHRTDECRLFLDKSVRERSDLVNERRACFNCLNIGHTSRTCKSRKQCQQKECGRNHHTLLHDSHFQKATQQTNSFSAKCNIAGETSLLQIMPIEIITPTQSKNILSLWDSASTVSLILNSVANTLKIPGKAVSIVMETLGQTKRKQTKLFMFNIRDQDDNLVPVEAYGVDQISTEEYSTEPHRTIFPTEFQNQQDKRGFISLLLGLNVVQYHPVPVKCCGNFFLFENAFRKCVSGTSPTANSIQSTTVNFNQSKITVDDFYKIENLGISCSPKCGNCKCGQCGLGASEFSIKDKRKLELIHNGISLENKVWTARYPWIKNTSDLPNNKLIAAKMLQNTEKRLLKDEKQAETYQSQIQDMLDRGVAKKLDAEDLNYDGRCITLVTMRY